MVNQSESLTGLWITHVCVQLVTIPLQLGAKDYMPNFYTTCQVAGPLWPYACMHCHAGA